MSTPEEEGQPSSGNARILIVDDEPTVTKTLVRILEENGFEAAGETSALRLIARVSEFRPDLIVMDIDMPHLVGTQAAWLLRKDPAARKIPIIFLSGVPDEELRVVAEASGGAAFLEKPVDPRTLVDTIRAKLPQGR